MRRKRRTFSKKFKREAVELVTDYGYSYAEAGRSLDIDAKLAGRWHRELEAAEARRTVSAAVRFIDRWNDLAASE